MKRQRGRAELLSAQWLIRKSTYWSGGRGPTALGARPLESRPGDESALLYQRAYWDRATCHHWRSGVHCWRKNGARIAEKGQDRACARKFALIPSRSIFPAIFPQSAKPSGVAQRAGRGPVCAGFCRKASLSRVEQKRTLRRARKGFFNLIAGPFRIQRSAVQSKRRELLGTLLSTPWPDGPILSFWAFRGPGTARRTRDRPQGISRHQNGKRHAKNFSKKPLFRGL